MASYQGHLMFSSALGAAYGSAGVWALGLDWGPAFLGAGVTTLGGLLPDLDSDSGVPVRELFGLAAAVTPLLLLERLRLHFTGEETLVLLAAIYLGIRYGAAAVFKRATVHRGMFHSIPALLITGLAVYLFFHSDREMLRWYVAGGTMVGFLSHLVLDELYSVDFTGARLRLNKYAGSALKFWSRSVPATLGTYLVLAGLVGLVFMQLNHERALP
jgi:membrane-bound metal-dependent hydrolase YbcI (DUF457 family)